MRRTSSKVQEGISPGILLVSIENTDVSSKSQLTDVYQGLRVIRQQKQSDSMLAFLRLGFCYTSSVLID